MDSQGILRKYAARLEGDPSDGNIPEQDVTDDLGCFGWLRGARERAVMLELRKKTGNRLAIAYSWIERLEFDPSDGIVLVTGPLRVHVRGRNLNAEARPNVRLFEGLTRHRVPWIEESSRALAIDAPETASLIDSIIW